MDWNALLQEYFIKPVYNPTYQGYNLVNTIVYGIILLVLAFFVIFPILHRKKIKFNYRFCLALIPYILIGTSLRAINHSALFTGIEKTLNPMQLGFWTFTPGVWFLVLGITILGLIIARVLEKKGVIAFHKAFASIGLIFSLPLLFFLFFNFSNWLGFIGVIIAILTVSAGIVFALKKCAQTKKLALPQNNLVITGQVMDSVATGFAINFYSFGEQHFLSEKILNIHPLFFLLVKVAMVLVILKYVDSEIKRENLQGFIKTFLFVLGFATGLASVLKIGLV